jgi:O-antigen biosynthesis protein WbqP
MKMSTPHDVPTHMLDHPEQYITRVGKLLRKTSLDELPQIWNIAVPHNLSIIGDGYIIGTTKKNLDFSRVVTA